MKFSPAIPTFQILRTLLLSCLLLVSCAQIPDSAREIDRSPNDQRDYRAVQLDNGLKVLLVSDPDSTTAAASLDIAAGFNSDPQEFPGLAHFLEHMLFLGTENFPEAGEYQQFISSHGGGNNAYTSYENTSYYFDIDSEWLEPALQRFADFFISPLFTADYVDRERQAVNSEYQAGMQDDSRRGFSVLKAVMNQAHPLSRFSTGSLETLQDSDSQSLRDALLEHFRRWYSAQLMTLVILGSEPLDELEEMAMQYFSAVPGQPVQMPVSQEPLFNAGSLPALLEIQPVRDSRSLSFIFPIAPVYQHYHAKPLHYLGNVLGHEGEGSLLALLRLLGWANALSAGGGFAYPDAATFTVNIGLTESGEEHIDEIAGLLFQFIGLVREQGVHEWLFREQQLMAELAFRFQSEADPGSYVGTLSRRMQEYPPEEVLTAPYSYRDFDEALIREVLDSLNPDNVLLTHTSKAVTTDSQDAWYKNPYRISALAPDRLEFWKGFPFIEELAIAAPNPFIPEDLELKPWAGPELPDGVPNVQQKPQLILQRDGVRLWHRQDDEFLTPRANLFVYALTEKFSASLRQSLLSALAVSLVNDKLNEFSYPANLAGSYFGLSARSRGWMLTVSGYSDKQDLLLETLLRTLSEAQFAPERFEIIRSEFIRSWQNAQYQTPYIRLFEDVQGLLTDPYWSEAQRIAAVSEISLEDVIAFIPGMLNELRLDVLYHGNVHQQDALHMLTILQKYLHSSSEAPLPALGRVLQMPADTRVVQDFRLDHDDSAIVIYLQGEDDSLHNKAAMELLGSLMATPFYESLRTEQQLGYIVNAGSLSLLDTSGMVMYIESPASDAVTLEQRINVFLQEFMSTLEQMPEEDFAAVRLGLLNELREPVTRLSTLSNRYWNDIVQGDYTADSRLQLADEIAILERQELLEFYRRRFIEQAGSRLVARSSGRSITALPQLTTDAGRTVELQPGDADAFKAGALFYEY